MLVNGDISSKKTEMLIKEYAELVNSGVDSSEILVILQNSSKKKNFVDKVLEKVTVNALSKLNVYSFFGLVYNTISDNWVKIENTIPFGKPSILPNLVGMEVSQFILRDIISEIKFEGYNSKKSLLHQLFRRYSLIVQNNLSDEDVKWRSEKVLGESFAFDAKLALDEFKKKTLEYRGFDYLRQGLIFNYLYKNTNYFSMIKYIFVDDGDEITPICLDFIKFLKPQLENYFISYDKEGGSRVGYLSADKNTGSEFESIFDEKAVKLKSSNILNIDADVLYSNVIQDRCENLKNVSNLSFSKRAQMLDRASDLIKDLIDNKNLKPSDISVVTPVIDDMTKFCLKENFQRHWLNLKFLSGSEKLAQKRFVLATLAILKLVDEDLKSEIDEFDIRAILSGILEIPLKYCREIIIAYQKSGNLISYTFENETFTKKYTEFLNLLNNLSSSNRSLSEQIFEIYNEIMDFSCAKVDDINKFNFFVKEIEDFENVFSKDLIKDKKSEIINQIENSIISENPYAILNINEDELVIATPQKIIDNQIETKIQIWLDVSSDEWIKSDTGPLYNAWVFQSGWGKNEFTLEDNIELSKQKNARVLRKLILCAGKKIYCLSSLFDGSGVENFGGIEKYLRTNSETKPSVQKRKFTPRSDQKQILEYKKGKMAISAVPGAGKTTILLELLLKLLEKGIKPENIFVLTYMESAARNFRERIQNENQNFSQLPNISTIHGLALRILKENGNFEKIGLNSDFEICDDTQRTRVIREIGQKLIVKGKELEDFDRAISVYKMENGVSIISSKLSSQEKKKLDKFLKFFNEYDKKMKSNNLIDYDDMLIFSVKLLKENNDILRYYQDICHYIIEDEAQDSSGIQQELLSLLSEKHKNLIRCGDVNQAITTTFSNADVEGFKKFINMTATSVKMDCSQRCSLGVYTLANSLIPFDQKNINTKKSFYPIFMKPVEGKNPIANTSVVSIILENEFSERKYVLQQIKLFLEKNPKATVGILLRNNYQVTKWAKFIDNSGLKSITRSECLNQKGVFRTIFAILKIILSPFDNINIAENYDILSELGHYQSGFFSEIKNFKGAFIEADADNIHNASLLKFYWDLTYWLEFSTLPPEELAMKVGLFYYSNEIEKSNVYLISTLIKRLSMSYKNYSTIIERLGELAQKPSLSGFKFFSQEDESSKEFLNGNVQIMTLHKSKGDEFDCVFLPEMTEKNLTLDFNEMKLKGNASFMENVRGLNPEYKRKSDENLKSFLLEENFRLLYVAITRAKRKLFITTCKKSKSFGNTVEQKQIGR